MKSRHNAIYRAKMLNRKFWKRIDQLIATEVFNIKPTQTPMLAKLLTKE